MKTVKSNIAALVRAAIDSIFSGHQGSLAYVMAARELFNNACDADAEEIIVWADKGNFYIFDDGIGFSEAAQISWLSFGFSEKRAENLKKAGRWGTGGKAFLSLLSTQNHNCIINVVTTTDGKRYDSFDLSMDHIIRITSEKETALKGLVSSVKKPVNWPEGKKRGSLITVTTGHQGTAKKVVNILKENVQDYLVPSTINKISISGHKLSHVVPNYARVFTDAMDLTLLGKISCELYAGWNPTGMGAWVCGSTHTIVPLQKIFSDPEMHKTSSKEEKAAIQLILSCGGYITIPKMKLFRTSGNVIAEEFYTSGFCQELVRYLTLIAPEIKRLKDVALNDKLVLDSTNEMRAISNETLSSKPYDGKLGLSEGRKPIVRIVSEKDVNILPKNIDLISQRRQSITLRNSGTANIDFTGAIWSCDDPAVVTLENIVGGHADVVAGDIGETKIKIVFQYNKERLEHIIDVKVRPYSEQIYIKGPSVILPNSENFYRLMNSEEKDVRWSVSGESFTFESNLGTVKVTAGSMAKKCLLRVSDDKGVVIASKNIQVSEDSTNSKPIIIAIGDEHFEVQLNLFQELPAAMLPSALASTADLSAIGINPTCISMTKGVSAIMPLNTKIRIAIALIIAPYMNIKYGDTVAKALFEFYTK